MQKTASQWSESSSVTVPLPTPIGSGKPTLVASWHMFEQSGKLLVPYSRPTADRGKRPHWMPGRRCKTPPCRGAASRRARRRFSPAPRPKKLAGIGPLSGRRPSGVSDDPHSQGRRPTSSRVRSVYAPQRTPASCVWPSLPMRQLRIRSCRTQTTRYASDLATRSQDSRTRAAGSC